MSYELEIRENVDLASLTTLQVGGPARYFAVARTEAHVREAIEMAEEGGLPLFVLGGGSNLLVSDAGFDGMVLQNRIEGIAEGSGPDGQVLLDVGAGEDWDTFVERCVASDLAGIECLSGIPGTVGATPIQNVGAYGQEVSETIVAVTCIDRVSGEAVLFDNAQCSFAYRSSVFNTSQAGRFIVTSVRFSLTRGGAPQLAYEDIRESFAATNPTLADVRSAVLAIRAVKSMVVDPADPNSRSAGSFFKNPIVPAEKLQELQGIDALVPSFSSGDCYKIPAAWLIESAGFRKGFTLGRAGISSNHSLAIINRGGATAAELVVLRDEIRRRVAEKFGITLLQEPTMLGFD